MDDFIQILIYLIIIITFLSSLFRKKEKEPPRPVPQRKPEPRELDSYGKTAETEEDERDIFREISDLFKTDIPQDPEKSRKKTTIEQRTENIPTASEHAPEEFERTESEHVSYEREPSPFEHSPTYSEHKVDSSWHSLTDWTKRKKPKIDSSLEKQADSFQKLLERKKIAERNIYSKKIKETLKNPQSLKEYIVISEIIGRPKALKK